MASDLPGYPDNISRGGDGLIWVTIASPVDALVERQGSAPLALRNAVPRVHEALQPEPQRTIRVRAYDDDGGVWMGSLNEAAVAVHDRA